MDPPPYNKAVFGQEALAAPAAPTGFAQPYPGQAMPAFPQQAPMGPGYAGPPSQMGGYPGQQMGGYPGQQPMPGYGVPGQPQIIVIHDNSQSQAQAAAAAQAQAEAEAAEACADAACLCCLCTLCLTCLTCES